MSRLRDKLMAMFSVPERAMSLADFDLADRAKAVFDMGLDPSGQSSEELEAALDRAHNPARARVKPAPEPDTPASLWLELTGVAARSDVEAFQLLEQRLKLTPKHHWEWARIDRCLEAAFEWAAGQLYGAEAQPVTESENSEPVAAEAAERNEPMAEVQVVETRDFGSGAAAAEMSSGETVYLQDGQVAAVVATDPNPIEALALAVLDEVEASRVAYSTFTIPELKALLDAAGVQYKRRDHKATLVEYLLMADQARQAEPDPVEAAIATEEAAHQAVEDLDLATLSQFWWTPGEIAARFGTVIDPNGRGEERVQVPFSDSLRFVIHHLERGFEMACKSFKLSWIGAPALVALVSYDPDTKETSAPPALA